MRLWRGSEQTAGPSDFVRLRLTSLENDKFVWEDMRQISKVDRFDLFP